MTKPYGRREGVEDSRRVSLSPEEGAFVQIPGTAGAVRLRALPAPDGEEDPNP